MSWSASEVLKLTRITYRQLDYWTTRGWLVVDYAHPGQGNSRLYATSEVTVIGYALELIEQGVAVAVALTTARQLRDTGQPVKLGELITVAPGSAA